jgi:hypothetical protein
MTYKERKGLYVLYTASLGKKWRTSPWDGAGDLPLPPDKKRSQ